jgi:hypothetical protein
MRPEKTTTALPPYMSWKTLREGRAGCAEASLVTVEADQVRVELRLVSGRVDCPACPGTLRTWGWARPREVHGIAGVLRPRRLTMASADWSSEVVVSLAGVWPATKVLVQECVRRRVDHGASRKGLRSLSRALKDQKLSDRGPKQRSRCAGGAAGDVVVRFVVRDSGQTWGLRRLERPAAIVAEPGEAARDTITRPFSPRVVCSSLLRPSFKDLGRRNVALPTSGGGERRAG